MKDYVAGCLGLLLAVVGLGAVVLAGAIAFNITLGITEAWPFVIRLLAIGLLMPGVIAVVEGMRAFVLGFWPNW